MTLGTNAIVVAILMVAATIHQRTEMDSESGVGILFKSIALVFAWWGLFLLGTFLLNVTTTGVLHYLQVP